MYKQIRIQFTDMLTTIFPQSKEQDKVASRTLLDVYQLVLFRYEYRIAIGAPVDGALGNSQFHVKFRKYIWRTKWLHIYSEFQAKFSI